MALILWGGASRLVPVWLIASVTYVTAPELAKSPAITAAHWPQFVVATGSGALGSLAAIGFWITTPGEMATVSLSLLAGGFWGGRGLCCSGCGRRAAGSCISPALGAW